MLADERGLPRRRRGRTGRHWWARRWLQALEELGLGDRLARGRVLARSGAVTGLILEAGEARAEVAGPRGEVNRVEVALDPIGDADWERVQTLFAGRALFAARLLAGEMPEEIEETFAECGLALVPRTSHEIRWRCTCPEEYAPCVHAAALFQGMAERFHQDPFQILLFRGRGRDELLTELRQRWAQESNPADRPGDRLGDRPVDRPVDRPGDRPGDRPVDRTASQAEAQEDALSGSTEPRPRRARGTGRSSDAGDAPAPEGSGARGDAITLGTSGSDKGSRTPGGSPAGGGFPADGPSSGAGPSPGWLEEVRAGFWKQNASLEGSRPRIEPPLIPESVLLRLGPPPSSIAGGGADESLRHAYRVISAWALKLAEREAPTDDGA